MLDILARSAARATFFISGERAAQTPELVARMVAEGHEIYAHGWEHVRLDAAGLDRLIADMTRCEELLARFRPTPEPYLVRLPYAAGYRSAAVHRALRRWRPGAQMAHWSAAIDDIGGIRHATGSHDVVPIAERCAQTILDTADLSGTVLLMHDHPYDLESPVKVEATIAITEAVMTALGKRKAAGVPLRPLRRPTALGRFALN